MLYQVAADLVAGMRRDSRPRFLRVETYRLKAHSKGDDTRSRDVVAPFEERDPLNRFLTEMSEPETVWVDRLREQVRQAVNLAEEAPAARLPAGREDTTLVRPLDWTPAAAGEQRRMVSELNACLTRLMHRDKDIFLMGEDILSPYGGAFKATRELSDIFPDRVRNTPISEACIVGMGGGLGLMGYRPIVEIMFGDFLGLAFDQIVNHAAKFRQMYNHQVSTNLVVRTPMGGGRGYGPTHSQTLDKHFLGVPGLRVLALNALVSPDRVYEPLLQEPHGPSLVIENKLLYGSYLNLPMPDGYTLHHSSAAYADAWVRPDAQEADITLLGYGGVAQMLVQAANDLFEHHDVVAQVLVVSQIYPFHIQPYLPVLALAPGLLLVEEGQAYAGFGSEVLAQLAEHDALDRVRVRRLAPPAYCIPSSGPLEKEVLPDLAQVIAAARALEQA